MATTEVVTWGAAQLHPAYAATYGTRKLLGQHWGKVPINHLTRPAAYGWGEIYQGTVITGARQGVFDLMSFCGSEANAWSEFEAIKQLIRPSLAPITLTKAWTDAGGAVSRTLKVKVVDCPETSWLVEDAPRFIGPESRGIIRFPISWQTTETPFFRGAAESDTTILSTTIQTKSITNGGHWPIGLKLVISGITGVEAWTSLLVTNSTTGPNGESGGSFTWTPATPKFVNTDYIDWRFTSLAYVTQTTGTSILAPGTANIILWPGANTLQFTGFGGTTPAVITVWWQEMFF